MRPRPRIAPRAAARPIGPRAADDFDTIGARLKELEAIGVVVDEGELLAKDCCEPPVFERPVFLGIDMARDDGVGHARYVPPASAAIKAFSMDLARERPAAAGGPLNRAPPAPENMTAAQRVFFGIMDHERLEDELREKNKAKAGPWPAPSKAAEVAPEQAAVTRAMRDMIELGVGRERIYMAPRDFDLLQERSRLLLQIVQGFDASMPLVDFERKIANARSTFPKGGDDDGGTQEKG